MAKKKEVKVDWISPEDQVKIAKEWLKQEPENEKSLENQIKTLTQAMDELQKESLTLGSEQRKKFLKEVSKWSDIVKDENFTEDMFLFYQNYIGHNPEILLDFIKTHKLTEEFMERFFKAKKWGIHPAYILKHQSHLTNFIIKYKEYFNPSDYDKVINFNKWEDQMEEVKDSLVTLIKAKKE